ncbi:MAG: hypothetical protein J6C19_05705 [Lachnospiraceae bacterium]|nr:hypothetical protein [Lachnospiraceae bacterium]
MTPYELQEELAGEVEYILKDMVFKDVNGSSVTIKAFAQSLPKRIQNVAERSVDDSGDVIMPDEDVMQEEKPADDPYPYCIVMLDSGSMSMTQNVQQIRTILLFGIYDDDIRCLGHQAVVNILHRIAERFAANPVLNNRYQLDYEAGISWTLDDEDRYPYYFGAMEMAWNTLFVSREEDKYA